MSNYSLQRNRATGAFIRKPDGSFLTTNFEGFCCCCGVCDTLLIPACIDLDISNVDTTDCWFGAAFVCDSGDVSTSTIRLSRQETAGNACAYYSCDGVCFDGGYGPTKVWAKMWRFDEPDGPVGSINHALGRCGWVIGLWFTDPTFVFFDYPSQVFIRRGPNPLGDYGICGSFCGSTCGGIGNVTATDAGDSNCEPCPPDVLSDGFGNSSGETVCPTLEEVCSVCCKEYDFHFTGTTAGIWDDITFSLVHPCTDETENFWEWDTQIDGVTYTGIIWCTTIFGNTSWNAQFQDTTGNIITLRAQVDLNPDCPPTDIADWFFMGDTFGGPIDRGGPLAATLSTAECGSSSSSVNDIGCEDYATMAAKCCHTYTWEFSGGSWDGANVTIVLTDPDTYWHGGIILEGGNILNGEMYCYVGSDGISHWRAAFADDENHQLLFDAPKANNSDVGQDCPPAEGDWIEINNTSGSTLSIIMETDCVAGAPMTVHGAHRNYRGKSLKVTIAGEEIILPHRHGITFASDDVTAIHHGDLTTTNVWDFRGGKAQRHDVAGEIVASPKPTTPKLPAPKKSCGRCSRAQRDQGKK